MRPGFSKWPSLAWKLSRCSGLAIDTPVARRVTFLKRLQGHEDNGELSISLEPEGPMRV